MQKIITILKSFAITSIHILFWISIYFFYTYFLGYGSTNTAYANNFSYYLMPISIIISYFFLWYLIPKYLQVKKHYLFALYTLYTFIVAFFFIIVSILYGFVFSAHLTEDTSPPLTKSLLLVILGVYLVVLLVITIGLIQNSYKSTLKNEDLKNKFLATQLQLKEQELKFLKMQIHPHFLFNTLNTLYGFTLKKSDLAPELILKLSNLLDYILYQVNKPLVSLEDELLHIEDYIALEKMRFQNALNITVNITNFKKDILIPPMLLLPFVENAFKHGSIINEALAISINLETQRDSIFFKVSNTYIQNTQESEQGIGLSNLRKRLTMLYKTSYTLIVTQENDLFNVSLTIPITNE